MLTPEIADGALAVSPLQAPPFTLDLVVIEAARRPPSAAADAFLAELAARIEATVPPSAGLAASTGSNDPQR
jgi:hypothetical protein